MSSVKQGLELVERKPEAVIALITEDVQADSSMIHGMSEMLTIKEDILGEQIKELQEKKKKIGETKKMLEDKLSEILLSNDVKKVETPYGSISFRKSTSVQITGDVEDKYMVEKVTKVVDKRAIKAALENGEAVLGAELLEKENIQLK